RLGPSPPPLSRRSLSYRDTVERPAQYWGQPFLDYLRRVFYWNEQVGRLERPALLDLLNVKYYLVPHGASLPPGAFDYPLAYSGEVDAYENTKRLPRAFVVRRWEFAQNEKAALEMIRDAGFNPRLKAVLCCDANPHAQQSVDGEFQEAQIPIYDPDRVRIE